MCHADAQLQKQFDALERGQREAILVKNSRTRKEYAIIPQATFQKLRPLLKHAGQKNGSASEDLDSWTEAKNIRRVALINKKHDDKLTDLPAARSGFQRLDDVRVLLL